MQTELTANLRRLLARRNLTIDGLVQKSGLDRRTIQAALRPESKRPHAQTLHRLAEGLEVDVDELFRPAAALAHSAFDRATNPAVSELIERRPELFEGWLESDFDELYSQFGAGGALTGEGAEKAAQRINRNKRALAQAAVVLESSEGDLLASMVDLLYRRIVLVDGTGTTPLTLAGSPLSAQNH